MSSSRRINSDVGTTPLFECGDFAEGEFMRGMKLKLESVEPTFGDFWVVIFRREK
jgi:hypothetical protein